MKCYELEIGDKELNIDIYDDGDIEITIRQEFYGRNDGGKAAGDMIIPKKYTAELYKFLETHLTPLAPDLLRSEERDAESKPSNQSTMSASKNAGR